MISITVAITEAVPGAVAVPLLLPLMFSTFHSKASSQLYLHVLCSLSATRHKLMLVVRRSTRFRFQCCHSRVPAKVSHLMDKKLFSLAPGATPLAVSLEFIWIIRGSH